MLVLAFAVVGLVLRAATIDTRGLWLDEATTILQTSGTLLQTIQSQIGGTHPPLFHSLMHFWIYLFGTDEPVIRAFALVFGVASIPVAYWAGTAVYDRRVGVIAAGILAISPYHIWYSQEARMYTMVMFFALLSVGTFSLGIETNRRRYWIAYAVFSGMGAFTQYLFLLLVIGQGIYYLLFEVIDKQIRLGRAHARLFSLSTPRDIFKDIPTLAPYTIATVAMAIPVLLWMNWAVFFPPDQEAALVGAVTNQGLGYGAPKPSLAIRFNDAVETLVQLLFGSHSPTITYGLVAMWPLVIYFALFIMGGGRYVTRRTTMLLCSASGVLVVWGLGQWQGVVLLSRYLMPMAAPALLLLASVIAQIPKRSRRFVAVVGVLVCLLAYVTQSFDADSVLRYQNRETVQHVLAQYKPGDIIIYEPFYIDVIVNYYLPNSFEAYGFPRFDERGAFRDSKTLIYQDLARTVGSAPRVWVIRAFQNVPSIGYQAYLTDQWFKAKGYKQTDHLILNKSESMLYTRSGPLPAPMEVPGVSPTPTSTPAPKRAPTATPPATPPAKGVAR